MKWRIVRKAAAVVLAASFAVCAAPMMTAPATADDTYYVYLQNDTTTLRSGPGYEYGSAGKISKKGKINYLGSGIDKANRIWYKVGSADKYGWVSAEEAKRYFKSEAKPKGTVAGFVNDYSAYSDIYTQIYESASTYGAAGVQVALITGKTGDIYDWNYGWADYGSKKLTADAKFEVGEVGSAAIAACAYQMQEQGLLNMSSSIAGYWGIQTARTLSLTMLLTHSSTLKNLVISSDLNGTGTQLYYSDSYNTSKSVGNAASWQDNPIDLAVAASTLEMASGYTLESWAKTNLFGKIGVDLSFFPGSVSTPAKVATHYGAGTSVGMFNAEARVITDPNTRGKGQENYANTLTGSAKDIARLYFMLANEGVYNGKRVLTKASVEAIEKKMFTVTQNGANCRQCVGIRYRKDIYGQSYLYFMQGEAAGVQSFAAYDPTTKNTLVVIASGASDKYDSYGIHKICGEIAGKVFEVLGDRNKVLYKDTCAKGKALEPGDTIGIVATSYYIKNDAFTSAVNFLKKNGYNVRVAPSCVGRYKFYAGTARQRAKDINDYFADDTIDGIMCLHGGSGASQILDLLDYDLIARHPKLFIGYSDVTAVHIALNQRSKISTVHGSMLSSFINTIYRYTNDQFFNNIVKTTPIGEIKLPSKRELEGVVVGTATGKVIGGNLTVIASLAGTEYEVDGILNYGGKSGKDDLFSRFWVLDNKYVTVADYIAELNRQLAKGDITKGEYDKLVAKATVGDVFNTVSDVREKQNNVIYWWFYKDADYRGLKLAAGISAESKGVSTEDVVAYVRFKNKVTSDSYIYVKVTIPAGKLHMAFGEIANKDEGQWHKNWSWEYCTGQADADEVHMTVPAPQQDKKVPLTNNDFYKDLNTYFVGATPHVAGMNYEHFSEFENADVTYTFTAPEDANAQGYWEVYGSNRVDGKNVKYLLHVDNFGTEIVAAARYEWNKALNKYIEYPISERVVYIDNAADNTIYSTVHYDYTNAALDILNYVGCYNQDGDYLGKDDTWYMGQNRTFTAYVEINIGKCYDVMLTNNRFRIRFVRPINLIGAEKEMYSHLNELQVINVKELVKIRDYRRYLANNLAEYKDDYNNPENGRVGQAYYGITALDVDPNYVFTDHADVSKPKYKSSEWEEIEALHPYTMIPDLFKTDANGNTPLNFSKANNGLNGVIEYNVKSSTTGEFHIYVPITITYAFGTKTHMVYGIITVKSSVSSEAKKN